MTMVAVSEPEIMAGLERQRHGQSIQEEAQLLSASLRAFTYAAWPIVVPSRAIPTWHIDAICEHVQAAYERQIPRLAIAIPPGYLKSTIVSKLAPAWCWTRAPEEQIVSASHGDSLATRDTVASRRLLLSSWFQARWPHLTLTEGENMKTRYSNTAGGHRVATHVGGGTGERGSVLSLDDPHNAQDALKLTETDLNEAREWIGNTWNSRLNATNDDPGVKIVIGQRIHQKDVIGFLLDGDVDTGRWHYLCLPARYSRTHPHRTTRTVRLPNGDSIPGDRRTKEGALLAPRFMGAERLAEVTNPAEMGRSTFEAQYQQNPTPREGSILKTADWRYFPREWLLDDNRGSLPEFRTVVVSADTSLKAKASSDKVAIGAWGVAVGAKGQVSGYYGLRTRNERLSMGEVIDTLAEWRGWAVKGWPQAKVVVLVEKTANGPEVIAALQREITGVLPVTVSGDKKLRAEAASPALESHQVFVPGAMKLDGSGPDPALTDVAWLDAIEQASKFTGAPGGEDDWVDQFTQVINWARSNTQKPSRVIVPTARIGSVGGSIQPGRATGPTLRRSTR